MRTTASEIDGRQSGTMRKPVLTTFMLIFVLISGCAITADRNFTPYVGMSEEELYKHWGRGGDSSTYYGEYGTIRHLWYSKGVLGVMGGCSADAMSGNPFYMWCASIIIEDKKVVSIAYH